jgi:O-antigen ligase
MINGAGNEALIESLNIYVLYPSFYIFFIASLTQVLSVRTLTTLLLAISIATSYIVIAHVFRIGGVILPGYKLLYLLYPELQISIKPFEFAGNTGYLPRVMERLIFLGPFSVVLVAVRKSCGLGRLLAVMGVGALWVIVQPKRAVALGLTAIGGVAITVVLFGWNATGISVEDASLTRIVESYTESTLTIRRNQFAGLMAAAAESPLLGVGFGNSASGYLRDTEHPWRYELTYVALFFQTGILGVILYAIVFILLLLIAINSFRKSGDVILPYIFGLAGGLMSVATNPYLSYGTGQWILFLPLAAFNCVLLAKDRKVTVENKLPTRNVRTE